jgi:hypothetical protein
MKLTNAEKQKHGAAAQASQAYAFHPLADLFPLIEGREFEDLVADIKANGLIEDIVLFDGMILDGRNRYRACMAAGVPPITYNADKWIADPAAFVISANIRRRHLNREQRGELLIKIIAAAPEKSDRQIAKSIGVDHKTIGAARAKGEQLGSVPQLESTLGADGKSRKRPVVGRMSSATEAHEEDDDLSGLREMRAAWKRASREGRASFLQELGPEVLLKALVVMEGARAAVQRLYDRVEALSAEARGATAVNTVETTPEDAPEIEPKRRGRPPDSKNKPKESAADVIDNKLGETIEMVAPTVAVDDDFSDTLAARMPQGESTGAPDDPFEIPPMLERVRT